MLLRSRMVSLAARRGRLLLIPACVAIAFSASANEIDLPLLKDAKALQCAKTQPAAKAALSRFWEVQGDTLLTPVEEGRALESGTLHAATLDIILNTLVDTVERYPDLRNQVERTMLQWSYCDSFNDGNFYDIEHINGLTKRTKASYVSPEAWQGFKKLGFLGETEKRFIPDIISSDQNSLRMDFEQLFHRIYREQCFPHPDTSELFDIAELESVNNISSATVDENKEYPHFWESECLEPKEIPVLRTQLLIEDIPLPVPELKPSVKIVDVPQLVPGLKTFVRFLPVEQLVPGLKTAVNIEEVTFAVPTLQSKLEILPVAVLVPTLDSLVKIIPVEVDIPKLEALVELIPVAIDVPKLESLLELVPVEADIPVLQTIVEVVEQPLNIPVLNSSVEFDQAPPKIFSRPSTKPLAAPVRIASARGGVGGYGGVAAPVIGSTPVRVQPLTIQPVATRPVAVQPIIQQVAAPAPVIQTQPTIIVDKNASLLERLLAGLNNGTNVLVIDKIQLTVNEYNGNVETAISSSDVGTASVATALDNASLIKELVRFNTQKPIPDPEPVFEEKEPYVEKKIYKPKAKPRIVEQKYFKAPALESILIVSPVISKPLPKKVVIKRNNYSTVKVPGLKTQLIVKAQPVVKPKKKAYKKPYKAPKKKQVIPPKSSNSSVFIYKPYKDGHEPAADEKSVEQLLQEYADYEARRKSGRSAKKKVKSNKAKQSEPLSKNTPTPAAKQAFAVKEKTTASKVPKVNTTAKSSIAKQQKAVGKQLAKEPEVVLGKNASKPENKIDFKFADAVPDYADMQQVTASATNTPSGLSVDAPLPYVIEENFINDQLSDEEKASKSKKTEKKPIGLAGNVYLKKSLGSGKWGIGGSINRKIIKDDYWFARVGWSYSLEDEEEPFSYSWGIGYSDWHSGTFSAQLNNWGPIKPGEGLALDKAIASFGYSVKSELLKKYRLSLSGALNIPIDGNSSAAVNMRWSPIENWYINASVSQPLEGDGDPKWSYGFGYSDWRPNKFNLQYSNYGPNDLFYHNFQTNGTWSLSYNYKF